LSNWTVHLSKPFPYGDYWAYVFAVEGTFERRLFKTQGGADDHWSITKTALSMWTGFISLQELPLEQAQQLKHISETWYSD
jgi:hypothetical protein